MFNQQQFADSDDNVIGDTASLYIQESTLEKPYTYYEAITHNLPVVKNGYFFSSLDIAKYDAIGQPCMYWLTSFNLKSVPAYCWDVYPLMGGLQNDAGINGLAALAPCFCI